MPTLLFPRQCERRGQECTFNDVQMDAPVLLGRISQLVSTVRGCSIAGVSVCNTLAIQ